MSAIVTIPKANSSNPGPETCTVRPRHNGLILGGGRVSDITECPLNPNVRIPHKHARQIHPISILQSIQVSFYIQVCPFFFQKYLLTQNETQHNTNFICDRTTYVPYTRYARSTTNKYTYTTYPPDRGLSP